MKPTAGTDQLKMVAEQLESASIGNGEEIASSLLRYLKDYYPTIHDQLVFLFKNPYDIVNYANTRNHMLDNQTLVQALLQGHKDIVSIALENAGASDMRESLVLRIDALLECKELGFGRLCLPMSRALFNEPHLHELRDKGIDTYGKKRFYVWMTTPLKIFSDQTPWDLVKQGEIDRVINRLHSIDHGLLDQIPIQDT